MLDKPASASPDQRKFAHPDITAKGETRASVRFTGLKTLWLNTGTLCNIECANCYIESSPRNDRLVYLTRADAAQALDEAQAFEQRAATGPRHHLPTQNGDFCIAELTLTRVRHSPRSDVRGKLREISR